ncbi:MAG: rhomboid family intramembrane serine protease, partial [Chloroflexota bacterium]
LRVVGINLLIGLVLIRVNNWAHIGGLVGGLALGYMFLPWYTVVETIPQVQIEDANSLSKKSVQAILVVVGTVALSYALWYFWRLMTVPF